MSPKPRRLRTLPRSPKSRRMDVTRAEFNHVIDLLNERGEIVDQIRRELDIQFKRIAQLQFELDDMKKAREF
jgi:hypothetical protein